MSSNSKSVVQITAPLVHKILKIVDAGLIGGKVGKRKPGHMCVEAAVSFALGEEFDDQPSCVSSRLANFKISCNDTIKFASNKDRARALRRIAIAQLGTTTKPGTNEGFDVQRFLAGLDVIKNKLHDLISVAYFNAHNKPNLCKLLELAIPLGFTSSQFEDGLGATILNEYTIDADNDFEYFVNEFADVCRAENICTQQQAYELCMECVVQLLIQMKTPGSKYLYLAKPPKHKFKLKK